MPYRAATLSAPDMTISRFPLYSPLILMMAFCLGGCSGIPKLSSDSPGQRAFIRYWPPQEGNKQLRLGIKDNIDMKGVVTTAGSEYLDRTSRPAEKDAPCLAIARKRNVR